MSPNKRWQWEPSNEPITDLENGLVANGQWIPSVDQEWIRHQTTPESENKYVGVTTTSPIVKISDIRTEDLLIYHPTDSIEYQNNSAPIEVYFSLNYNEIDQTGTTNLDVVKYSILEWGDEETILSAEDVLNSEFF